MLQGELFEAALPTAQLLTIALASCTLLGRPYLLEGIEQIVQGNASPSEIAHGNELLTSRCRDVVTVSLPQYLAILEQDASATELEMCVSILGCCAEHSPDVRATVAAALQSALLC